MENKPSAELGQIGTVPPFREVAGEQSVSVTEFKVATVQVAHLPFTWWPWKTLALAVPLMALASTLIFALNDRLPDDGALAVFFSVIGAGNAYMLAMANGSLGRSMLAIPIGVAAGFLSVELFSSGMALLTGGILLGIFLLLYFLTRVENAILSSPQFWALISVVVLPFVVLLILYFMPGLDYLVRQFLCREIIERLTLLGALFCFVFVNLSVCAAMTYSLEIVDPYGVLFGSGCACVHGLCAACLSYALVFFVFGLLLAPLGLSIPLRLALCQCLALGFSSLVFNYVFMRRAFVHIERTVDQHDKRNS